MEHEDDTEISMEHNHQNDYDDSFAILCVCSCCGISVTHHVPPTFVLHSKINISTKVNSQYESHYQFRISSSIWQPPQFVS